MGSKRTTTAGRTGAQHGQMTGTGAIAYRGPGALRILDSRTSDMQRTVLFFTLLISGINAHAQSPESVARGYMEAMRAGDMEQVVTYMHPSALEKFKGILVEVADIMAAADPVADPKKSAGLKMLFGEEGPQMVKTAEAKEVFVRFMRNLTAAIPRMRQMLASSTYQFIGHVDEGGNQTHVVYRATLETGGAEVTKMEVLTLKRDGEEWRVMLTGDIESLVGGLGRQLRPPDAKK